MKTLFFKSATLLLKEAADRPYKHPSANLLALLIDNTRNENGSRPEIRLETWSISPVTNIPDGLIAGLTIDFYFENDKSDESELLTLPILDFQQWIVWNGYALWYRQEKGRLAWKNTVAEYVSASIIMLYLQDLCNGLTAYKQAEFSVCEYDEGEIYDAFDKINKRQDD